MRKVAYLVNRYPEATLTAIRREIVAVAAQGISVHRFAHRRSVQPLAGSIDKTESELTEYLAEEGYWPLLIDVVRSAATRPIRFVRALRVAVAVEPSIHDAVGYLALACRLRRRLRSCGVDLLHVHFGLSSAMVGLLTRELGGPPLSVTIHGPEEFSKDNHERLSSIVRSANQTCAISDWAAAAIRTIALPVVIQPCVIRMGVDDSFLAPTFPIDSRAGIVCVARLDARKGHAILLDALSRIDIRKRDVRVELIGDGPLRPFIEAELSRLGLATHVKLRGWLGEADVKVALDRCRCLVLPSLDEGLPVSVMEAFARARPVVATNVAGMPELVIHRVNGAICAPNDAEGLARALDELLSCSSEELYRLGLNGRSLIEKDFSSERNAQSICEVWQQTGKT